MTWLLALGGAGTVIALLLALYYRSGRNAAEQDAKVSQSRMEFALARVNRLEADIKDLVQRSDAVVRDLKKNLEDKTKELYALASKDPAAAGTILDGVLSLPSGSPNTSATGMSSGVTPGGGSGSPRP